MLLGLPGGMLYRNILSTKGHQQLKACFKAWAGLLVGYFSFLSPGNPGCCSPGERQREREKIVLYSVEGEREGQNH